MVAPAERVGEKPRAWGESRAHAELGQARGEGEMQCPWSVTTLQSFPSITPGLAGRWHQGEESPCQPHALPRCRGDTFTPQHPSHRPGRGSAPGAAAAPCRRLCASGTDGLVLKGCQGSGVCGWRGLCLHPARAEQGVPSPDTLSSLQVPSPAPPHPHSPGTRSGQMWSAPSHSKGGEPAADYSTHAPRAEPCQGSAGRARAEEVAGRKGWQPQAALV